MLCCDRTGIGDTNRIGKLVLVEEPASTSKRRVSEVERDSLVDGPGSEMVEKSMSLVEVAVRVKVRTGTARDGEKRVREAWLFKQMDEPWSFGMECAASSDSEARESDVELERIENVRSVPVEFGDEKE